MVSRSRYTAISAMVVGAALAVVGAVEYLLAGLVPPPMEPFATGVFVVVAGGLLVVAGGLAYGAALDHLSLRLTTFVGLATLLLAVFFPDSLLFGGVVWLGMIAVGVVVVGAYRTVSLARSTGEDDVVEPAGS